MKTETSPQLPEEESQRLHRGDQSLLSMLKDTFDVVKDSVRDSWNETQYQDAKRISMAIGHAIAKVQIDCNRRKGNDALQLTSESLAVSWPVQRFLDKASDPEYNEAFYSAACEYLSGAFQNARVAKALLSTPGTVRHVLEILRIHPDVARKVWTSMESIDDNLAISMPDDRDLLKLLEVVEVFRQDEDVRRVALKMLRFTANEKGKREMTPGMMRRMSGALSTASNAIPAAETDSRVELARIMRLFVKRVPSDVVPHAVAWLWPLLCFAADGVGSNEICLVNESLEAFTACVDRGAVPAPELVETAAFPLLYSIADRKPKNLEVGVRIAECIGALGRSNKEISQVQRMKWAELFVSWLIYLDPRISSLAKEHPVDSRALAESTVDALESLSSAPGIQGLQVVHAWLAEIIVHLSKHTKTFSEMGEISQAKVADLQKKSSWTSWIPYHSKGSSSKSEEELVKDEEQEAVATMAELMLGPAAQKFAKQEQSVDDSSSTKSTSISWWRYLPHPWKSSTDSEIADAGEQRDQEAEDQVRAIEPSQASDPELSLYINAAPIGRLYARSVAAKLLETSGNAASSAAEMSQSVEEGLSPTAAATYSNVATTVNREVADKAVCQALKVLSALASGEKQVRTWLVSAGAPRLLRTVFTNRDTFNISDGQQQKQSWGDATLHEAIPLHIQRQVIRLLALLSMEIGGAEALVRTSWIPWLQHLAASEDCKVSSHASRALLHIETAGKSGLMLPKIDDMNLLNASRHYAKHYDQFYPDRVLASGNADHYAGSKLIHLNLPDKDRLLRRENRKQGVWKNLQDERLVLHDGIHLFSPLNGHHEALAQMGINDRSPKSPDIDIVFLHGIRGGAFITWRFEGALSRGKARGNVDHSVSWPAAWLAPQLPNARLISAEYAAPASGWEGESLPLNATASHLADKLAAAGVGSRPIIFICHSMGGLIAKEIIRKGTDPSSSRSLRNISKSTVGAVFYSVPHAGSRLADWGWTLRYIGAAPSRAVAHLKTGPHLEETNEVIKDLCKRGKISVLSFSEGLPTKLSYVSTHVVPHESAYPGYGDFVVLPDHDHITACKPSTKADPAFSVLLQFLLDIQKQILEKDSSS